jgi:hypothetical protein
MLAHCDTGSLQGSVRRRQRELQGVDGLLRRPAEHVAEDQDRPLPRGQVLDGHDERQFDGLPGHRLLVWVIWLAVGPRLRVQHLCANPAPCSSVETGARSRRFSRKSRQALVAIRYSQVRSDARPWKDSRFPHARGNVSWVMSWATSYDPSIRLQWASSSRRKRSVSSANPPMSSVRAALMNSASSAPIGLDGRCSVVYTMSPTVAWRSTHVDGTALENQSVGITRPAMSCERAISGSGECS